MTHGGAIRSCIAHEIGNLLLKHYAQGDALGRAFKRQRTCSPLISDGSEIERVACVFATECLMPTGACAGKKSAGLNAWIPGRRALAPNSAASDYFDDDHLEASRVLPAATWFPRETHANDAAVYKHMTAIPEQAAADRRSR